MRVFPILLIMGLVLAGCDDGESQSADCGALQPDEFDGDELRSAVVDAGGPDGPVDIDVTKACSLRLMYDTERGRDEGGRSSLNESEGVAMCNAVVEYFADGDHESLEVTVGYRPLDAEVDETVQVAHRPRSGECQPV